MKEESSLIQAFIPEELKTRFVEKVKNEERTIKAVLVELIERYVQGDEPVERAFNRVLPGQTLDLDELRNVIRAEVVEYFEEEWEPMIESVYVRITELAYLPASKDQLDEYIAGGFERWSERVLKPQLQEMLSPYLSRQHPKGFTPKN